MSITYVGAGTLAFHATGATSAPYPAGIVAGDLLISLISSSSNLTPGVPTGFTDAYGRNDGNSGGFRISYKVATGTESGSLSSPGAGAQPSWARVLLFRGVDNTNPIDSGPTNAIITSTGGTMTLPGFTTTVAGVAFVYIGNFGNAGSTWTPPPSPAAFTELDDLAANPSTSWGYLIWSGSGATGNFTLTHATGGRHCSGLIALRPAPLPPGVPTTVAADPDETEIALTWAAPSTGGPVTSYEVRLDGGSASTATSPHTFTGLSPGTSHTVEVRAVGPGGSSSWVLVNADTLYPTPPGYYRVELGIDSYSWDITKGEPAAYGPLLPLTLGYEIPSGEFFPAQPSLSTMVLYLRVPDADDIVNIVKGSTVTFRMYVDADPDAEPWQSLDGVVTQLEGESVPSLTDPDAFDFRATVYVADDTARLADMQIGYTSDWPMERISERVDRILAEAGIDGPGQSGVLFGLGQVGWLPARPKAPTSVLDALRVALRDAADDYASEFPHEFYGRYVYQYRYAGNLLQTWVFRRRVFSDGTPSVTLDGAKVRAAGRWTKQPGPAAATWGLVNDTVFGTPDSGPPFVRTTNLVSVLAGAPDGGSATEIDSLGESLLPDGSTALDGWSTRTLTYLAYLDPDPVRWWVSIPEDGNSYLVTPVFVTPIADELELNGVDYIAGTLTGARLVIGIDGKFRVEFQLRAELLPNSSM